MLLKALIKVNYASILTTLMTQPANISNILLIIIVIISFSFLHKQLVVSKFRHLLIKVMLVFVISLLLLDIFFNTASSFGNADFLIILLSVLISICIPAVGNLWLFYIHSLTKNKIKFNTVIIITSVLLVINVVLAVVSIIPGFNIYTSVRNDEIINGPLFFVFALLLIIPYAISLIMVLQTWSTLRKKRQPLVFVVISVFPVLGLIGQVLYNDFSISLASIVLTYIIIILDMQNQLVVTDYLTGLYNRRRLAQKLTEKINHMKKDDFFGGYMIDLNNFKQINDTFGHNYGDLKIQDVAALLLRISGPNDLVSRFGGDEFVIIKSLKTLNDLNSFKHKIISEIRMYNAKCENKAKIQIGIGAALYTKNDDYSTERFLEIIDELMYKNKKMIKEITDSDGNIVKD